MYPEPAVDECHLLESLNPEHSLPCKGGAREARIDNTSKERPMPSKSLNYGAVSIDWAPKSVSE